MKNKSKFIILALIILISIIEISYAFFVYYKVGDNSSKLIFGDIYLKLNSGTDSLTLLNVFPETKEKARAEGRTDNIISFTVSGINSTTNKDIWYEIMLNEGNEVSGRTRFNPEDLVFDLVEIDENKNEKLVVEAMSFGDINERRIWVNTVSKNTTSEINKTYKLRVWLSEDVFISDTNPNATYDVETFENSYASVKVSVYGDFVEKETSNLLANLIEEKLILTDADSNGVRYVNGSKVNNYLWYSGKLWRIVAINSDGSVKIVTQNDMTSIIWRTSNYIGYSSSYAKSWLENIFLPTLHNDDGMLVEGSWDTSLISSVNPITITGSASYSSSKIGLLSAYDYIMTGGTNSSSTSNSFLNNGYQWWTMSSRSLGPWYVSKDGIITGSMGQKIGGGIRPAVILKSNINVIAGAGTKNNPYKLANDVISATENDALNSRISGEYIKFNDTLYRIVGVEEFNGVNLTKVTMMDYSKNNNVLSTSVAFGASTSEITFNTSYGIGKYLDNWYNGASINDVYKSMIATADDDGIFWYVGPTSGVGEDYTLSNTGTTVSATIGLGRYGEMYMSQFGESSVDSADMWTITKASSSNSTIWRIYASDLSMNTFGVTSESGVRPSFYLKSNIVIGDVDGDGKYGTGLPNDPYEIKQVS